MKIILCYPPKRIYQGYGQDTRWLPLGIASIGAYINKVYPDLDIVLLDCFNMTPEVAYNEIQKEVPKNETVIIGFTLFTEQRFSVINLCKALKNNIKDANIITVVGGAHAFIMSEQIEKEYSFIDHIIKGEGEEAFNIIVKYYTNIQPVPIPRIIEAENIQDLSTLPHSIDGFKLFKNLPEMTEAPIIFSRGCTDMCTFCSTTKFWKGYRSRKATDVFNEMLKYFTDYNITYFKFHDDACTANIDELKNLCKIIIELEYNNIWKFELTARADQFDDELIGLLKLAGCKKVALGIESGNLRLRESMNKRLNMDVAKQNMKKLMIAGIEVVMLLIIGYPGENDDTIKDTVDLIREVKPTMTCKQPLMIFPGTKVYSDLVKQGWINDDYWLKDQPQPYYTREANFEQLNAWINKVNSASKKLNILLAVPARQTEEKFKLHVESLNRLIVPDYVNLQRLFILHNSDELKKYLLPSDNVHIMHTDEEYIVDDKTHHWKSKNLQIITFIKNEIIQAVLNNSYDYVFFVDSDLLIQPETLLGLIESGKDIIAEIFWTDWTKSGKEEPNAWDFDHYKFFQGTMEQWKIPGIYKCGGTGACILIHRSVYERGVNYNPIPNVSFWGEDRAFSIRAYVAGFEMWVDTHYPCEHMYRDADIEKAAKFFNNGD